jgi:hypothetical protein
LLAVGKPNQAIASELSPPLTSATVLTPGPSRCKMSVDTVS